MPNWGNAIDTGSPKHCVTAEVTRHHIRLLGFHILKVIILHSSIFLVGIKEEFARTAGLTPLSPPPPTSPPLPCYKHSTMGNYWQNQCFSTDSLQEESIMGYSQLPRRTLSFQLSLFNTVIKGIRL